MQESKFLDYTRKQPHASMKPCVLIVGNADDISVQHITQILESRRVRVVRWDSTLAHTTLLGKSAKSPVCFRQDHQLILPEEVTSVWLRGFSIPRQSGYESHRCRSLLLQALETSGPKFWVNHPEHALTAEFKNIPLVIGPKLGLRVPRSLFTNDSEEVERFFDECKGKVLAKSFFTMRLGNRSSRPSLFKQEHLGLKTSISLTPMLYQEFIEAPTQLRIVVMGNSVFCGASKIPEGVVDIRVGYEAGTSVLRKYSLTPSESAVYVELRKILHLNIVVCDVAVGAKGEHILLDVNPAGVFGLHEKMDANLPTIEAFTQFIVSGDDEFAFKPDHV